jgi:hypothetical protein
MSEANKRQVGGDHYKVEGGGEEHWDRVHRLGLDYFQAQVTKYVERCWKKHGLQDLNKAAHVLEKYMELNKGRKGNAEVTVEQRAPEPEYSHRLGAQVYPTGWVGFTFEGVDINGFLFTCRKCQSKFYSGPDDNPYAVHAREDNCPSVYVDVVPLPQKRATPVDDAEATPAYIGQAAD